MLKRKHWSFFVNKGLGRCNQKVQSSVGWRSKSIAFESKRVVNYCLLDGKKTLRKRKGSMFSLCQHIRLYGDSSHVIAISLSAHMIFTFAIFPIQLSKLMKGWRDKANITHQQSRAQTHTVVCTVQPITRSFTKANQI